MASVMIFSDPLYGKVVEFVVRLDGSSFGLQTLILLSLDDIYALYDRQVTLIWEER